MDATGYGWDSARRRGAVGSGRRAATQIVGAGQALVILQNRRAVCSVS